MDFIPMNSSINPSFWCKYTELKLDVDRLSENEREIWGYYSNLTVLPEPILEVDSTSFNQEPSIQTTYLPYSGIIVNKNNLEEFKCCGKNELINREGRKLWKCIKSGEAAKKPSLLNRFFILSYVDLKKYHYYYWFAFPVVANLQMQSSGGISVTEHFNENQVQAMCDSYCALDVHQKQFFVITKTPAAVEIYTMEQFLSIDKLDNMYLVFSDSSKVGDPGWPVRNCLILLLYHRPELLGRSVNVIGLRLTRRQFTYTCKNSLIFNFCLPRLLTNAKDVIREIDDGVWLGYERNERRKMGPRMSNMRTSIDPKCLADSAVDLNLKLMKWRLLPDIDLDKIKNTKCLLLGAGTLGCSVARNLLAWGIRNISFVDNSTVSFSNPVRQSLFTFQDCAANAPKAEAAAVNLKKIFPGVQSMGYRLNIPMPGHPAGACFYAYTKDAVQTLTNLISQHDAIFILMDSRESRWLPTLLGNSLNKIVINAAIGFDTYLVMRHGAKKDESIPAMPVTEVDGLKSIAGNDLGCYFCNDITAPGNSLKDRTLDQQCTVTRPGVSNIAGALAAELLISILQHSDGSHAPAFYKLAKTAADVELPSDSLLGILPHSIRGFLHSFTQVMPATERFYQCIACSKTIVEMYEKEQFEFLMKVFNDSKYLEELTGLDKLFDAATAEVWDFDDGEDF